MIDITGVDLVKFVQDVYALSRPQGLGFIHFQEGALPEADAKQIIDREEPNGRIVVSMDYVKGRACKMTIFRKDGRFEIGDNWFDHNGDQLKELLARHGKAR